MHPSSLLSYYPTYAILDDVISRGNYKTLHLHIDLKNNLQSTYMEHAIVNIVESSKTSGYYDTSIFSSLISFLSFHKIWGMKRGIDVNFYIFYEMGESYYHKNISKKYKISRKIDDLYGLDRADRELFFTVLQTNFRLIEKALNLVPKTKVFLVPNLEADFIPYFLLSRGLLPYGEGHGHLVYSNDHDLWQCAGKHSYIFSKAGKHRKIIQKDEVMKNFLKKPNKIPDSFLPLAMSIIGDTGDDVYGIKGVGPASFIKMFDELVESTGSMREIFKKVREGSPLFSSNQDKIKNKQLKEIVQNENETKLISNNLKLVSFELISRAVEDPSTTEMNDKRKLIIKTLEDNTYSPRESLKKALVTNNIILEDASVDFLYI